MVLGMAKNTSITLGNHLDEFIESQVDSGKYSSASEVVRAGLRMLEDHETKVARLQAELRKGESGKTMTSEEYASSFMKKRQAYLQQTDLQS